MLLNSHMQAACLDQASSQLLLQSFVPFQVFVCFELRQHGLPVGFEMDQVFCPSKELLTSPQGLGLISWKLKTILETLDSEHGYAVMRQVVLVPGSQQILAVTTGMRGSSWQRLYRIGKAGSEVVQISIEDAFSSMETPQTDHFQHAHIFQEHSFIC